MLKIFYSEVKRDGEKASAGRLHRAAHECLRQGVLSCLTGIYAQNVRAVKLSLAYGPHGKPYLASHPAICFSLSHAGNMALCAISELELGADIQDHRAMDDGRIRKLAARFYAQEEQQMLCDAPCDEERRLLFFRIWAAKEAFAKYTGKGLAEDFTRFFADFDTMRIRKSGAGIPDTRSTAREPGATDAKTAESGATDAGADTPVKPRPDTLGYLYEPLRQGGYSVMICTDEPVHGAEITALPPF